MRRIAVTVVVLATVPTMASVASASGTLVLLKQNGSVGDLSVCGTVTSYLPEVDIATVNTDNVACLADVKSVEEVLPDLTLNWIEEGHVQAMEVTASDSAAGDEDDPFYGLQWNLDALDAPEAWAAGLRGAGATVAVLDTGFDLNHPDLMPNVNLAISASFVPFEELRYGYPDVFSHGTHCAGIVAAADNGTGVIGVAPEAELMLVKVVTDAGWGDFSWLLRGIVHATDHGADVISMSLAAALPKHGFWIDQGAPGEDDDIWVSASAVAGLRTALGRATGYAHRNGATLIAGAGNDFNDGDHDADQVILPADAPHVMGISATGPLGWGVDPATDLDAPAYYTNHGQSAIDFAAPGGNVDFDLYFDPDAICQVGPATAPCWAFDLVYSTGNQGWYWSAGTSMACPAAAGVAALAVGANGGSMHPAQVRAALLQAADDRGKPGNDDFYGNGRLNGGRLAD